MTAAELNKAAQNYFDIQAMIEELQAEAEAIKEQLKAVMVDRETEELKGEGWSATWHNTTTNKFDSKAFKAENPEIYQAYTKPVTGTRFTLCTVKVA